MLRSSAPVAFLFPLLLLTAAPASSHNGEVALAVPVNGITVDGDLSDWPASVNVHGVNHVAFGDRPRDAQDLQATMRVGYDRDGGILYLGIEALDESHVLSGDRARQDGCRVGLGFPHNSDFSGMREPAIRGEATSGLQSGDECVAARRGAKHTYEWRLTGLGSHTGTGLTVLNLDVAVLDWDADGSGTTASWGPQGNPTDLQFSAGGDAVLTDATGKTGRAKGRIQWNTGQAAAHVLARFSGGGEASGYVETRTDGKGQFQVELPIGAYQVEALRSVQPIEVQHGTPAEVSVTGAARVGLESSAGEGETRLAGSGWRKGVWHTLSASDGLPATSFYAAAGSEDGAVWLGTMPGLIRYDGSEIRHLGVDDGLPHGTITSLATDRNGVWAATPAGIAHYDGERLLSLTPQDGLASHVAHCVAVDSLGRTWIGTDSGVSVFDGVTLQNLTAAEGLPAANIRTLVPTRDGAMWVGTEGGPVRIAGGQVSEMPDLPPGAMPRLQDREGGLWFGSVRRGETTSHVPWGPLSTRPADLLVRLHKGHVEEYAVTFDPGAMAQDGNGHIWAATWGNGAFRYDGSEWSRYGVADGLANEQLICAVTDREGCVWLGSLQGGVTRYDAPLARTFTTADGLPNNLVFEVLEDRHGTVWMATLAGLGRYDGSSAISSYTVADGLPSDVVRCLAEDGDGSIWVGTTSGAVRLTGGRFEAFDQAPPMSVRDVLCDRQGNVWFAAATPGMEAVGVVRFDGADFVVYDTRAGLADNAVSQIVEDGEGRLWFATGRGLSVYEDGHFVSEGLGAGLPAEMVLRLATGADGSLWAATRGGEVYRFDGQRWERPAALSPVTGLVLGLLSDTTGTLWLGTWGTGIVKSDGRSLSMYQRVDGLAHDGVQGLSQARNGDIWIATEGGATRYRPSSTPPKVRITGALADRRYAAAEELQVPASQRLVQVQYQGTSMRTRHDRLLYRVRLLGQSEEWFQVHETDISYEDLPVGEYTFEVVSVDHDLQYSEPARLRLVMHEDYGQLALRGGLALSLVGLVAACAYGVRRRRDQLRAERALMADMEKELQAAHDLQLGLMPTESPDAPGISIAGRCVSANHVGGDFYQYFEREEGITVSLADVTGHAMEAAIPATMFSGILDKQMEIPSSLEERFAGLNRSLCRSLGEHTYVCLTMLDIDASARGMRAANCGCPYPLHFRRSSGVVEEVQVEAYPLGIRPDTVYRARTVELEPGDYVVLHSDGLSEARNAAGEVHGFDRTMAAVLQGCLKGLHPEELAESLVAEARHFTGDEFQADDMTCVVIRAEE